MEGRDVYLAGAVRTPIGKFGGRLAPLSAVELGATAVRAALERTGMPPEAVDLAILGHARQAGNGPNVARQVALRAGCPESVPAYTINMACASGLQAIVSAAHAVALGEAEIVLAGGTESMSNVPFLLDRVRWGRKFGDLDLIDAMDRDGYLCPLCSQLMGETAENLVEEYRISREEQDAYALESQRRWKRAQEAGRWREEIIPVQVPSGKGTETVDSDEHPRPGTTLEKLATLPPVFRDGGIIHAGASSGITDGAAAILVLSEEAAERYGVTPMARIVASTSAGVEPHRMGMGPVPAVGKLLEKAGVALGEIELIELNEAFAAQVLACQRELGFDLDRTNVNGGAIALGHPTGCTGARITVTLLHEIRRRGARRGLATLCVSGGLGMGLLVEQPV